MADTPVKFVQVALLTRPWYDTGLNGRRFFVPLRLYLVVIRATFLKGVGLAVLWPDLLAMAILGAALLSFSVLRFRKSRE